MNISLYISNSFFYVILTHIKKKGSCAMPSDRYNKALEYAGEKHKLQKRIGGVPYITHPVAVAEYLKADGFDEDYQIAGLFHDLLEDTDATEDDIRTLGSEKILKAVKLLTKEKGYDMGKYIEGIKADPIAKAVKTADRLHNLRCAVVTSEDFKRRYILESIDWYLDFSPQIVVAVKELAKTLDSQIVELDLEYEPTDINTEAVVTDQ